MLTDFPQDIRIGFRSLLRVPVLAATIIGTVGLGIGATTAIFSAVHTALIRPLPYAAPGDLVRLYTDAPPFVFRFSVADYLALQAQQTHFQQVATYTGRTMTFSDGTVAELVRGLAVSTTYFSLLGIKPAMGRDFVEADGRSGSPAVVLVSHGFWQRRLGGRPDALGRSIRLDGADHTVVGVLPRHLGPLERDQEYFVAQQFSEPKRRGPFLYTVIARFRPGADRTAAAQELRAINKRIFPIWKSSYQDDKATWSMMDLKAHVVGDQATTAGLALSAVALVWMIACANASNLLVARATSRRRELAVRAALGASRGRVIRYLLAESAVLAVGSVAVGTVFTSLGIQLLRGIGATYVPRMQEIALDGPVLWLLAGLMILSGLIFGLIPAVHGVGGPVSESLQSLGRSSTGSIGVRRLRRVLVGSQFAVATPLLVLAALLLASLNALRQVELGFDTENLVTGSIRLPSTQYRERAQIVSFWNEIRERLESTPGVSAVAFADGRPPDDVGNFNNFDLEDHPTPSGQSQPVTPWLAVTPEYFRTLGLTLVEGRLLDERDALAENLESVVVDRAWARRFFPNGSAIGKRFRNGGCTTCPWTTVVGVVSEVKYAGLDQPDQGTIYTPMTAGLSRFLVVRTHGDALTILPTVRQIVREIEPGAPLSSVATMDDLVDESLERPRSLSMLVASFALVALALSIFGIYGVMAYYVQQHLRDIGIRIALGGRSADVVGLVVGQGMKVVALGVAAGLAGALGLAQLMASLLFGIEAADPRVYVGVAALLLTVAVAGCLLPAVRAIRVQPAVVLRNE